ncbi:SH3 domain-containing protein [Streptomyces sp. NPDC004393]
MIPQRAKRALAAAIVGLAVAAGGLATASTAQAAGEDSRCTRDWPNFTATVGKAGWNLRTGPSTGYVSRGLLYRGDKLTVLCSRGAWDYSRLTQRSRSGIPNGTRGWVRADGLVTLAG